MSRFCETFMLLNSSVIQYLILIYDIWLHGHTTNLFIYPNVFRHLSYFQLKAFVDNVAKFSCSVMSDSLQAHGLTATCQASLSQPEACSNSCPLSWWCQIQQYCPLLSSSPPAFDLSQHQGLNRVSSLHQVAKVLEFQLQHQSFQCIFRTNFL